MVRTKYQKSASRLRWPRAHTCHEFDGPSMAPEGVPHKHAKGFAGLQAAGLAMPERIMRFV